MIVWLGWIPSEFSKCFQPNFSQLMSQTGVQGLKYYDWFRISFDSAHIFRFPPCQCWTLQPTHGRGGGHSSYVVWGMYRMSPLKAPWWLFHYGLNMIFLECTHYWDCIRVLQFRSIVFKTVALENCRLLSYSLGTSSQFNLYVAYQWNIVKTLLYPMTVFLIQQCHHIL